MRWDIKKLRFDWLRPAKPMTLVDHNKLLENEAARLEKRADLLEEEAKIRKRLLAAKSRCEKAGQSIGIWKPSMFKWVLIAITVVVVLFAMVRGC